VEVLFDKRRRGRIHGSLNVNYNPNSSLEKRGQRKIEIGVSIIF
jgi:hypothetical protein